MEQLAFASKTPGSNHADIIVSEVPRCGRRARHLRLRAKQPNVLALPFDIQTCDKVATIVKQSHAASATCKRSL
jgi:hypothetical protein